MHLKVTAAISSNILDQWRNERRFGVLKPLPPAEILKALQNRDKRNLICENSYKLLNLGRQHPKMFGKKSSKILKLPRFAIVLH